MDITLNGGLIIRLDADRVEVSNEFNMYIFYRKEKPIGWFAIKHVEWISPTMKGE